MRDADILLSLPVRMGVGLVTNEEAIKIIRENHCDKHCCEFFSADCLKEDCALYCAIYALESICQIKEERDAFMEDFKKGFEEQVHKDHGIYRCDICKHGGDYSGLDIVGKNCPKDCDGFNRWEWKGILND